MILIALVTTVKRTKEIAPRKRYPEILLYLFLDYVRYQTLLFNIEGNKVGAGGTL